MSLESKPKRDPGILIWTDESIQYLTSRTSSSLTHHDEGQDTLIKQESIYKASAVAASWRPNTETQ